MRSGGEPDATREEQVKAAAAEVGFDLCGIAAVAAVAPGPLTRWLGEGMHAGMAWMDERRAERLDPAQLVPGAKSVIALAVNYYSPEPARPERPFGRVSRYAWGRDYHNLLVKRARRLRKRLQPEFGGHWYSAVDAGAVMEKVWAERAGIGWIGKNGCLLTTRFGSWVLLATLVTTAEFAADEIHPRRCGTCTACLSACPTAAFPEPGVVDARKCIAYHTIESREPELPIPLSGWAFGCDVCQDVCPWNRRAQTTRHAPFLPRPGQSHLVLDQIEAASDADLALRFAGTPIARATVAGLRRNVRALREEGRGPDRPGAGVDKK